MSIEARDLSVRLGRNTVVNGVSMAAAAGEITVVAGPNGAGKSTLLKALAGILPAAAGGVFMNGNPIANLDRRALGREIAYLPQDRILHWPVSVAIAVGLGRLPHRSAAAAESAADRAAIQSAMAAMDVAQFASRSVAELSGGERARVLMARALAQDCSVLIADEPTAGLDPSHALQLFAHLRRLAVSGHAVITALHDLSFAARFANRIVLMKDGRISAQGSPRDVLTADNLAHVYGIRATLGEIAGLPVVLAVDTMT